MNFLKKLFSKQTNVEKAIRNSSDDIKICNDYKEPIYNYTF